MKRKHASQTGQKERISKKTKDDDVEVLHYTKSGQLDMRYSSSKKMMKNLSQQSNNISNNDSFNSRNCSLQLPSQKPKPQKPNQPFRTTHSLQIPNTNRHHPFSKTSTPVRSGSGVNKSQGILDSSVAEEPQASQSRSSLFDGLSGQSENELSSIHCDEDLATNTSASTEPIPETETENSVRPLFIGFNHESEHPDPNELSNLNELNDEALRRNSNFPTPAASGSGYSVHFETTLPLTPIPVTVVQVPIPASIPRTKSKLPDMRTKAGREWIENQVKESNHGTGNNNNTPAATVLPSWLPRHKDGTIDTNKTAAQLYLNLKSQQCVNIPVYNPNLRADYYKKKLENKESNFYHYVKMTRQRPVTDTTFFLLANAEILKSSLNRSTFESYTAGSPSQSSTHVLPGCSVPVPVASFARPSSISSSSASSSGSFTDEDFKIPTYIPKLDFEVLENTIGDKSLNKIGNGAFGVVYKGFWNGMEVAIKKLFLDPLTTGDRSSFMIELKILASFGDHPNLVQLYGYTMEPCSLVMEFVKLGSLSHLLYYCEDDFIEANLCDGRIKKKIICGIVNGMRQLHSVNIIHGDLKPANILVTEDFTAKITDFGLARLRGKTSSLVASNIREDGENVVAGTAAYMAPELLDSTGPQELCTDVYSFAILVNEIIHEEEPYSQDYDKIRGRGPFGAANFAKLGHRPYLNTAMVPANLAALIRRCWNSFAWNRPTFDDISKVIGQADVVFPNFI